MGPSPQELLEIARHAAEAGGEIVARSAGRPLAGETKGAGDYVTEVDRASEQTIRDLLAAETPDIPVLAEEAGGAAAERRWVVDPLDGTTNHLHGFPIVGVSVALVESGRPSVGAVHAPFLAETSVAHRGAGAWLLRPGAEPRALRVSDRAPAQAVVGTGFPFRTRAAVPRYLAMFERCFERFEDLRRPGAASLDLAWVAAGVFDGFFELNLSPWDVAAGALLIEEAGGVVTDWEGGDGWLETGDILAGPPAVHSALLQLARSGR